MFQLYGFHSNRCSEFGLLGFDPVRAWNLPTPSSQCDKVPPPLFLGSHIPSPPVHKTWTHPHPNHFNHKDAGSRFT